MDFNLKKCVCYHGFAQNEKVAHCPNYISKTIDNRFDFEYDRFHIGKDEKAGEKFETDRLGFVVLAQTSSFAAANILFPHLLRAALQLTEKC